MEWDNYAFEEDNVLVSEWDSETRDNTGEDVKELCCSVELVGLVDETEEALIDCLSDHLSAGHQLLTRSKHTISIIITS